MPCRCDKVPLRSTLLQCRGGWGGWLPSACLSRGFCAGHGLVGIPRNPLACLQGVSLKLCHIPPQQLVFMLTSTGWLETQGAPEASACPCWEHGNLASLQSSSLSADCGMHWLSAGELL